jgi:hypothetical protein
VQCALWLPAVGGILKLHLSCIPVYPGATWPLINTPHRFRAWEMIHGKLPWEGAFAPENKTLEAEVDTWPGYLCTISTMKLAAEVELSGRPFGKPSLKADRKAPPRRLTSWSRWCTSIPARYPYTRPAP